jgi:hypothetical protein
MHNTQPELQTSIGRLVATQEGTGDRRAYFDGLYAASDP